ncbi:VOC family protein [Pseudonocardia sp. NPDC049154]|uniref:VOC family protein n=1 Tax=Pseudonocardia sp. NPDC049154 TaxID=3155501 RepID=UPI0033C6D40F
MSGIRRVAGAILAVADQDRMLEFFGRLGFETVTDAEMWPGARWVEVRPPGAETSVVLSAAKDFGRDPDQGYPMTFATEDVAAFAAEVRAAGVEVTEPTTEGWGTFVNVTDPEGRQLLVAERT